MKRLAIIAAVTVLATCVVFWVVDLVWERRAERALKGAEIAALFGDQEPAVIAPPETFAPPKGDVFSLGALDFTERAHFAVNRFGREPEEPLLYGMPNATAIAQLQFPGRDGSYRIWVDCFLRKNSRGRLSLLVDEWAEGAADLHGEQNSWARVALTEGVDIRRESAVAVRVEKAAEGALIGRVTFERLGDLSGKPPTIRLLRGPMVQWVTETSAYLVWETNLETDGRVEFGASPALGYAGTAERRTRRHVARLSELTAATEYFYRVSSDGTVLADGLSFRTNKPAGVPFRFAVFGDSGTGSEGQRRVAQEIEKAKPDFIVHVGDLIYGGGEKMNYPLGFYEPYSNLIKHIGFYPCLGNHDVTTLNGQPFLDTFVLPDNGPPTLSRGRNYWFEYGHALFVAADSNAPDWRLRDVIAPWVEQTMRSSPKKWKFVFFHHPPYSGGSRPDYDAELVRVRHALVPTLERAQPSLVFVGHDHVYARLRPIGGVRYIITGAGGAPLYVKKFDNGLDEVFYNARHSFTQVDIADDRLTLTQINDQGREVDKFELTSARPVAAQN